MDINLRIANLLQQRLNAVKKSVGSMTTINAELRVRNLELEQAVQRSINARWCLEQSLKSLSLWDRVCCVFTGYQKLMSHCYQQETNHHANAK